MSLCVMAMARHRMQESVHTLPGMHVASRNHITVSPLPVQHTRFQVTFIKRRTEPRLNQPSQVTATHGCRE